MIVPLILPHKRIRGYCHIRAKSLLIRAGNQLRVDMICTKCGLEKDEEEFYIRDKTTGQRRKDCKACVIKQSGNSNAAKESRKRGDVRRAAPPFDAKAYKARWYQENKTRMAEKSRQWALDHPEEVRRYKRRWYSENKAQANAASVKWAKDHPEQAKATRQARYDRDPVKFRSWSLANPEAMQACRQNWKDNNPERVRSIRIRSEHKRRVQKTATCEYYQRREIFERDRWICQLCLDPVDPGLLKISHYDPLKPTIDHVIPLSKGGGDNPSNVQLAHWSCNTIKRDKITEFENAS